MKDLGALVKELVDHPTELEWFEFKHDTNKPSMIGERISAIANSCAMMERFYGYVVWGVEDGTHKILGTEFKPETQKVKGQELKSWLHNNLSDNAEFYFDETTVDDHRVVILTIHASKHRPVAFQNCEYIRDGSYTKKLMDRPQLASRLWSALNRQSVEMMAAVEDCSPGDVRHLLAHDSFLTMLNLPDPTNEQSLMDLLVDNDVIVKQDNGLYTVTVLGALLFAKDLSKFDRIGRRALRIIKYNGTSKSDIARQEQDFRGYAVGFEDNMRTLMLMLPSSEVITTGKAELREQYSVVAIREILANAMIHQDLGTTGMNLSIEVFSNRVEISNPGPILVDKERLIDAAPRSRNEKVATMMRRVKLCEELGSGWDKIVESCEKGIFPVPTVYSDDNGTRVVLTAPTTYTEMNIEERLWNCYMHACSCFSKGGFLTNSSLRDRFGLERNNTNMVRMSNLIAEAKTRNLIKVVDENTSTRMYRYVPFWA
ncbi:MAG: putative DNA binding domain-containing protein [Candidatus Methanomethylophilaceae archaeon]|nr:putative DNA binding domain-containing protein [Candidatus Methanomethylophilaceae archaeon]